jgi:hypothetical protein
MRAHTAHRNIRKRVKKRFKNRKEETRDPSTHFFVMTGTKAEVSAPSPHNRRKRLGNVKAKIKAEL